MEEYDFEERKEFMLEILKEHKILLILDNFETISSVEQKLILQFFDTEVKRELRDLPKQFKVIVTSRELIPSGFHQVRLKGLDQRDSKKLMEKLFEPYKDSQKQLTEEQQDELHKFTSGIPIIIKHCYGQIFEYSRSIDSVLKGLSNAGNRVIDFSFSEIFQILKEDMLQLKIIILLEIINIPLMVRQIADIINDTESAIDICLSVLFKFQCVDRYNYGREEKYAVNEDVRMFTRRLTQENIGVASAIRELITKNYTIEKSLEYTMEEYNIITVFNNYLSSNNLLAAEDFLSNEISSRNKSVFLNFHYAKFIKERKGDIRTAITILESIRPISNNHPLVLQLLVSYYVSQDIPNYNQASIYVNELESSTDEIILLEVAEFYVKWSTSIKMQTLLDPIREMLRQQRYKELADSAIKILNKIDNKNHRYFYLLAQSFYNIWNYDRAFAYIEQAIALLPEQSHQSSPYLYFRNDILKKRRLYSNNHS